MNFRNLALIASVVLATWLACAGVTVTAAVLVPVLVPVLGEFWGPVLAVVLGAVLVPVLVWYMRFIRSRITQSY